MEATDVFHRAAVYPGERIEAALVVGVVFSECRQMAQQRCQLIGRAKSCGFVEPVVNGVKRQRWFGRRRNAAGTG